MHASSDSTYAARIEHVQPGRLIRPEPCRDQVLGQLAGAVHQLPAAQPVAVADQGAPVRHGVRDRADQIGQVSVHAAHARPPKWPTLSGRMARWASAVGMVPAQIPGNEARTLVESSASSPSRRRGPGDYR